ncbi:MAG TPA: hypothetical protein VNU03_04220, partial [Methylomirabilota bacterium]|nr:hypothetical protein [Methylomirabilota bacterium]
MAERGGDPAADMIPRERAVGGDRGRRPDRHVQIFRRAAGTSRIRLGPGIAVPHTRHISVTA